MKKVMLSILAIALVALPASVIASSPETASSSITADILTAYSVSKTVDLKFGSLIPSATAGTLVLTHAGVATETNVTKAAGYSATAATFSVSAAVQTNYTIGSISDVTMYKANQTSGANMLVTSFTLSHASGNTVDNPTFNVGATLNVGANQSTGSYAGSFPVTVNFN
jgi:small ligand-binding sensory domain FIST